MKKYTIGLITGALLGISAMMFMGSQNKNLGDITVNSIIVKDDGSGGFIEIYNADVKRTAYLGNGEDAGGFIKIYNNKGKKTSYLGSGRNQSGFLETYNSKGIRTSYLGTNDDAKLTGILSLENNGNIHTLNTEGIETGYFGTDDKRNGIIELFDRYGKKGWSASGKQ